MTTTLPNAINAVLDYLRSRKIHPPTGLNPPDHLTHGEVEQFRELAENVYDLAHRAGLAGELPKKADLDRVMHDPYHPNRLPPCQYETPLNLPGEWQYQGGGREKMFEVVVPDEWFRGLERVARLAEAEASLSQVQHGKKPEAVGPGKPMKAAASTKSKSAVEDQPLPGPEPYPVRVANVDEFRAALVPSAPAMIQSRGEPASPCANVVASPILETRHLEILPGAVKYGDALVELAGKPLACIGAFLDVYQNRLGCEVLRNRVWGDDAYTTPGTIKNTVKDARDALRKLARKSGLKVAASYDPLPCVDHGKDLAWKLNFPPS